MRCHYVKDEETGEKYLIPGCYGSLHRDDMEMCTCYKTKHVKPKKTDEYHKDELIRECRALQAINDKLNKQNRKLFEENIQLKRQGLPIALKKEVDSMTESGENLVWLIVHRLRGKKFG